MQTYVGHGGVIQNKQPVVTIGNRGEDIGELVLRTRKEVGTQTKSSPQIIFYILPGRDSFMYERLKKNMDCRWAIPSQSRSPDASYKQSANQY